MSNKSISNQQVVLKGWIGLQSVEPSSLINNYVVKTRLELGPAFANLKYLNRHATSIKFLF